MTSFEDDFAAALRGDSGYRGVEPKTAAALARLGLIDERTAWEIATEYERDWRKAWDDSEWWHAVAEIAWHTQTSRWRRFLSAGVPTVSWKMKWIRERRGS